MSKIPMDLKFTKDHGWIRTLPGQTVELGVTDHGQEALGDLISVELPAVGDHIKAGEKYVTLESAKTAFEVAAPTSGVVTAVNAALKDSPEQVNQDPYGHGWLVQLKTDPSEDTSGLLDATAYAEVVKADDG